MNRSLSQPDAPEGAATHEPAWQRLDPRRHFAAALGWPVFALVVAGALLAAELAASEAERHVVADTEAQLGQTAGQTADALMAQLQVPLAAMQATAAQWRAGAAAGVVPADGLFALQRQQPELGWIGVLDAQGSLQAATDSRDAAAALAGQPWLAQAARAPVVALHRSQDASMADALVLAVPLAAEGDAPAGSLLGLLPWLWLQAQLDARLRAMAGGVPMELLLLGPAGEVLAGPPGARDLAPGADLTDGGRYLVGRPPQGSATGALPSGAGWQVVVREDTGRAMARARHTRRVVLLGVLAVGLLAALAAVAVALRLLRRLDGLALQARELASGTRAGLDVPPGRDEVSAIGATLAQLVARLQEEKAALAALNAELDTRVAERTERIERLAEDARHAAVTRERLRLAREVHDTLAHSLMALLTQIRLVRKLGGRWEQAQLDAELASAERVCATGLAEARAAIGQMREGGLRNSGLGAELEQLLQRLAERSGVQVQARIDPAAAGLADARAATVLAIAREALRNVERHAGASRVTLTLAPEAPAQPMEGGAPAPWLLALDDDGTGFDPGAERHGHYGLTGLHEQAEQLGAVLAIDSAPGQGCRLRLRFTA